MEIITHFIGGLIPTFINLFAGRPRLKIVCGWGNECNTDGVGNFLAVWVKIINPTSVPIYFERIEAINYAGEVFFPSFYRVKCSDEISPRRNIVGIIPCGHITSTRPKELCVYDSTEQKYTFKGRALRKIVVELIDEKSRFESLNLSVHPTRPYPE